MKRAVIIGNGFDLAIGAKTAFTDFLKSDDYRRIPSNNSLKRFYDEQKTQKENWSDLEGSLKDWPIWLKDARDKMSHGFKKGALARVREDFAEVQNAIHSFISVSDLGRFDNERTGITKLLKAWYKDSEVLLYNFNYTSNYSEYLAWCTEKERLTINSRIEHVHGTVAQRNVTFGTTEAELPEDFKFAAKVVAAAEIPDFDSLLLNTREIEIFGHSLGRSDWNYFGYLFSKILEAGNDAPKVRIYTWDSQSAQRIRENMANMKQGLLSDLRNQGRAPKFLLVEELFRNRQSALEKFITENYPHTGEPVYTLY